MVIQNPDGSLVCEPTRRQLREREKQTYYTELPHDQVERHGSLFAQLIDFAFDVLGARHLEVRVYDPE